MEAAKKEEGRVVVDEFQEFVVSIARRLMIRLGVPRDQLQDLIAAGNLGLVEAADRYDPTSGHDFKHFAFFRIRGAIIDDLRNHSDLSGRAYRYAKALQAAQLVREEDFITQAPVHQRSTKRKRLERVLNYAARGALAFRLSLSECEFDGEIETDTPESLHRKKVQKKLLQELVCDLPAKERVIIEEYYFQDISFADIARRHPGMSKSWVSRLHARALERLKEKIVNSEDPCAFEL